MLTVDLEIDDGGEGIVDAVLRLAEVPPLIVLLDLVCGGRWRKIKSREKSKTSSFSGKSES